jgi:hypothetical protein
MLLFSIVLAHTCWNRSVAAHSLVQGDQKNRRKGFLIFIRRVDFGLEDVQRKSREAS